MVAEHSPKDLCGLQGMDPTGSGPRSVRVRFYAGARQAAGTADATIDLPPEATVADLAEVLGLEFGSDLAAVLAVSSVLVDGLSLSLAEHGDHELGAVHAVDVLPPFAGG